MTQSPDRSRRLVSPPAEELHSLRQPLTLGERLVYEFFDRYLPEDWEVYIQPHLNGLRPDFVLLHPLNGIAVFEVKDWNLSPSRYFVHSQEGKLQLGGNDGVSTCSLEKQNPVRKIELYKREIYELYCPRLRERSGFGAITAGILFPFSSKQEVVDLLRPLVSQKMREHPRLYPLAGSDTIAQGNIGDCFPLWNTPNERISHKLADDLRAWLQEPSFDKNQRSPLELSNRQRELIKTRTYTGYRRIKGAAGSGKSLVVAAKAAELASTGQDVLVCTYNITLINYLRDLSVRWKGTKARNAVTWLNFHYLCKRIAIGTGHEVEYNQLWSGDDDHQEVFNNSLPSLVSKICSNSRDHPFYDAILVDEGQDFRIKWWNTLRGLLKCDGQMVLLADRTQDIYGTAGAWTDDAMEGAGFRGPWFALDVSYRMPPKLVEVASRFAKTYLPDQLRQVPVVAGRQLEIDLSTIEWQQTSSKNIVDAALEAIIRLMQTASPRKGLAVADITVIVDSKSIGRKISDRLMSEHSVRSIDTFERNGSQRNEGRRKKLSFFMGDARVKITTIHSFKGWESRLIVMIITMANSQRSLAAVYIGLTRLQRSRQGSALIVVSSAPEMKSFAQSIV